MNGIPTYRKAYPGTQPDYLHTPYVSCMKRAPHRRSVDIAQILSEISGALVGRDDLQQGECDLTRHPGGEAIGERIAVSGRVLDENGRPVRHTLVEVWQ